MIRAPLIYRLRLVYREQEFFFLKKGNSYTENKQGI